MYFLNDKHSEYEYICYHKIKDGIPFLMNTFNSLSDIKLYINEIEKRHNRYGQIFYIDNDFYNNYYNFNCVGNCYYYKFLRRKVLDWEEFSTISEKYNKNILFFT